MREEPVEATAVRMSLPASDPISQGTLSREDGYIHESSGNSPPLLVLLQRMYASVDVRHLFSQIKRQPRPFAAHVEE
jgi:hypothetical protein